MNTLFNELNHKAITTDANDKVVFRMGELFCGPGGLALGAHKAKVEFDGITYGVEHVWANDFDNDTCKTFEYNLSPRGNCNVICKDVRHLDLHKLPNIDALAFGFPCNDFSVVGEQKGFDGVYGPLYRYGIKALEHFKPIWFIAENVSGLRNANDGKAFETIKYEMEQAGYNLFPSLYQFEKYGVPQNRHRLIIIGFRKDFGVRFVKPNGLSKPVSSREAIEFPPIPTNASNHDIPVHNAQVVERLKHIQPGENAFNADLPDELRLNVKAVKISQIYRRLDPDKPAYTITGSGGGGTHVYHWKENRALSNRERARLQTFPDEFVFLGSKESVRRQIGMAVPPLGAKIIIETVLKHLLQSNVHKELGKNRTKQLNETTL